MARIRRCRRPGKLRIEPFRFLPGKLVCSPHAFSRAKSPPTLALLHRELIITLTARHRMPAVYTDRVFVIGGGLISYGPERHSPAIPSRSRRRGDRMPLADGGFWHSCDMRRSRLHVSLRTNSRHARVA